MSALRWLALAAAALVVAAQSPIVAAAPKPHVVYLVIDDWGWSNFALHRANFTHGNDEFPTPALAALAADGMLLDRLYGHKFCGPSRASIQTGRNPVHVNVLDSNLDAYNLKDDQGGFFGIPRNMTGIAAKLKSAGVSYTAFAQRLCATLSS
jgi:arylsulfatase B